MGQKLRESANLETMFLHGSFKKVVRGFDLAEEMWFRGVYSMLGKYTRVIVWVLQDQGTGSIGIVKNFSQGVQG